MENDSLAGDQIRDTVAKYFRKALFLFTPLVCNARCSWCYVRPAHSEAARFGEETLRRLELFLSHAAEFGFSEIRITGGDPLVFANLDEVISRISTVGLSYTLLTNGIELHSHMQDFIRVKSPSKITISVHSIVRADQIFGVAYDAATVMESISELRRQGVKIAVTCLYLPETRKDLTGVIDIMAQIGVAEFKIVYPNDLSIGLKLVDEFTATVRALCEQYEQSNILIRWTNLDWKKCQLRERGYLSISLPHFQATKCCCITANNRSRRDMDNREVFEKTICEYATYARRIKDYPCITNHDSCPIALTDSHYRD